MAIKSKSYFSEVGDCFKWGGSWLDILRLSANKTNQGCGCTAVFCRSESRGGPFFSKGMFLEAGAKLGWCERFDSAIVVLEVVD